MKKVIATAAAFYNGFRVRKGAELEVEDNLKGSWFVAKETLAGKPKVTPKDDNAKGKSLSQLGKPDAKTFNDVHGQPLA